MATEHSYRPALSALLNSMMPETTATNEPKRGLYGAPDYLIQTTHNNTPLTLGYAEAKDVGIDLDATEKTTQLKRYRAGLRNLLLTDYLNFRWYLNGEKRGLSVCLGTWDGKKLQRHPQAAHDLTILLTEFAAQSFESIGNAPELAARMARLTHLIRTVTLDVLVKEKASSTLKGLLRSFRKTILPDLTHDDFADMYAQTLAYGLFAARVNHEQTKSAGSFTRQAASHYIPSSNPLLQSLFHSLTGPSLNQEPYVSFVDDLAQTLSNANIDGVLKSFGTDVQKEDPIVYFYESFLAEYNPRLRDQRGVYYTPSPVVEYIVHSVDNILKRDFGLAEGIGNSQKIPVVTSDDHGQPYSFEAPRLLITDPATGTGTFLYQIIRLLRKRYDDSGNAGQWSNFVKEHLIHALYGFELMMAPYAIAHLKLSMELGGLDLPTSTPEEKATRENVAVKNIGRLNIYLTNTLENPNQDVQQLDGDFRAISDEAVAAGKVKADYPIMVVLGNPPYSGHSANNNVWIDDLLKGVRRDVEGQEMKGRRIPGNYYEVDQQPLGERNPKWLQDDYVKFIRWAQWRIEETSRSQGGGGIIAFITPHGYLDNPTFRGMRQSLSQTFDDIYLLDLHGNANKKEKTPEGKTDQNVFDIRTGVCIGIFVRRPGTNQIRNGRVYRADRWGSREDKYAWLREHDVTTTTHVTLAPTKPIYMWADQDEMVREEYEQGWRLLDIVPQNVMGFQTHRDDFAVAFTAETIKSRINDLRGKESDEKIRVKYDLNDNRDWQLAQARKRLRSDADWTKSIIPVAYRPFDMRWSFYGSEVMDYPRPQLMENVAGRDNLCLGVGKYGSAVSEKDWQLVTISDTPMDANIFRRGGVNVFPLYLYPRSTTHDDVEQPALLGGSKGDTGGAFHIDGRGRTPNITKAFATALSKATKLVFASDGIVHEDSSIYTPENIFEYLYAILHSSTYRKRYADFLKTDFPRIPLPDTAERFWAIAGVGRKLMDLHLLNTAPSLGGFPIGGTDTVDKRFPKYSQSPDGKTEGTVRINNTQGFSGIPEAVWTFRVGGYQVAEKWLKDRQGQKLTFDDIQNYQKVMGGIDETIELMSSVDQYILGMSSFTSSDLISAVGSERTERMAERILGTSKEVISAGYKSSLSDLDYESYLTFIIAQYERMSEVTGDPIYSSRWFSEINRHLSDRTPASKMLSGDILSVAEVVDQIQMELNS